MSTDVLENDDPIICAIDGGKCHSIRSYILQRKANFPDWIKADGTVDMERYKTEFPGHPLLSSYGRRIALAQKAEKEKVAELKAPPMFVDKVEPFAFSERFMHDVFGFGNAPAAMSTSGQPISIRVLSECHHEAEPYLRDIDMEYVFPIDLVKEILIGYELGMNNYLWGLHGTGTPTLLQQCAARTRRPFMRVQHTGNTEEAHIIGQYVVKTNEQGGSYTEFQLGPLAMAMKYGMVYCADEYDFAMPSVIALYQPVLEGEPLVIKDAPPEFRVIRPHPDFRFAATGNTNGVGDETGLYQGTMIQNAASYSRFHITAEVHYMDPKQEVLVIRSKAGATEADAEKFVQVATEIRKNFRDGLISMTISPRELITAAKLAIIFSGDCKRGLKLAFTNRCSRVDQATIDGYAQRVFG